MIFVYLICVVEIGIFDTPPKIFSIEPENDALENDFPKFQGYILRFYVNLAECMYKILEKCFAQMEIRPPGVAFWQHTQRMQIFFHKG